MSLMQMAKVSALLTRVAEARLPFISLLTDPTTGGTDPTTGGTDPTTGGSSSGSGSDGSSGDDTLTSGDAGTGVDAGTAGGDTDALPPGYGVGADVDGGCACRSSERRAGFTWLLGLVVLLARRRRGVAQ